jgi:glucan phosphoethanolaminetransferase (alkaline phosphatase superfamily)
LKSLRFKILLLFIALVASYLAYAWLMIGPDNLAQPVMTPRGFLLSGAFMETLYSLLVAWLMLAWIPRLIRRTEPHGMHRKVGIAASLLLWLALWIYGAYSVAGDYAFYFGNTWERLEILLGFVLLAPQAILLLLVSTAIYGTLLRASLVDDRRFFHDSNNPFKE